MNLSFIFAAVAAIFGSLIVGLPVSNFIIEHLPMGGPFGLKLIIALALGGLYLLWVSHNTPTKNKGAVFAFDTYPVRMGSQGKGFTQGLNATPLGSPFFTVKDMSVAEKTVPFDQTSAFTEDNILSMVDGTYQSFIDDPYDTYNAEKGADALHSLIVRSTRSAVDQYSAINLIKENKEVLSNKILTKVRAELASGSAPWGLGVTDILRINHIRLPAKFEEALQKVEQEKVEGKYEQTQAERRREQANELIKLGIRPDVAYAGALVDAEKSGASLQNITIHGMEGLGPLADDLGALGRGLTDFAKTKVEPKAKEGKRK